MAEIIAEPTALSKVIALKFKINDVDVPKTTQLPTNKQFNTTDTDAWFTFELDGLASTGGTYDLTLINLDDKSIFHHANVLFQALPFHYKLNSSEDVTLNEIRHAGRWLGQLVVTLSNGDTTARQFGFNIAGHILDGQDAQVILLSDYQALINTINLAKDELAQYNVDYAALIADVTTAEGLIEQAEIDRAAAFAALVESEMIAQNVATKLTEKEATFAPRMLSLESELAETGKTPAVMTNLRNQLNTRAAITFTDDDATKQVWEKLRPFIIEMNIPYTLAVPPGAREMFPTMLSLEQLKIMQDVHSCEIASHSLTHPSFQQLTEEQKVYELTESKRILTQAGLNVKNMIYPFGSGFEESTQQLATQYYNCAVSASGGLNVKPVRSMNLGRVALGSYLSGSNTGTFEYYKTRLDDAKNKGGWEIYMTHVNMPSHTEDVYNVMRQIILYAREIGVDILNLQEGYERFGNIVEIPGKLTIQNDGEIVKPNFNNVSIPALSTGITSATPITGFPKDKISIHSFSLGSGSGFPHSNGGTLETYRIKDSSTSYQVWRPYIEVGLKPTYYYRRAKSDTEWYPFAKMFTGDKIEISATIGAVNAGKTVVADITVPTVLSTSILSITPSFNMTAELLFSIKRVNGTLLRLNVYNPTTSNFTVSGTAWQLAIID